jgi:hypothetical protein
LTPPDRDAVASTPFAVAGLAPPPPAADEKMSFASLLRRLEEADE